MAGEFRGPYQQDPFDHIVAIHFPNGNKGITKLDFVNDRYKVAGQLQAVGDVIDHPEWRTTAGLDLRTFPDNLAWPVNREARLKNKDGGPSQTVKGALSEFTFLDYTIVGEFDWYDREPAWAEEHPLSRLNAWDVFFSSRHTSGTTRNVFELDQGLQKHIIPTVPPSQIVSTVDWDNGYIPDPENPGFYSEASPGDDIPGLTILDDSTGIIWRLNPDDAGTIQIWKRDANYQYGAPPGTAYPAYDNTGGYVLDDGLNYAGIKLALIVVAPSAPVVSGFDPSYLWDLGDESDIEFSVAPRLAAWDSPILSPYDASEFRSLPTGVFGDSDLDPGWPLVGPAYEKAYGRFRVAINVTALKISMSVNGSVPVTIGGASTFAIPRLPPIGTDLRRLQWFPSDMENPYEFLLNACAHVRCLWLFRKRKSDSDLKMLSTVKTLPLGTDPLWDKYGY